MVLGALGGTESGRRLWREGDGTGAIASVAEKSDLAKLYRSAGGGAERGLVDKAGNRLLDAGGGVATFAAEKVLELAGPQRACSPGMGSLRHFRPQPRPDVNRETGLFPLRDHPF
jgi:hypothetical protein